MTIKNKPINGASIGARIPFDGSGKFFELSEDAPKPLSLVTLEFSKFPKLSGNTKAAGLSPRAAEDALSDSFENFFDSLSIPFRLRKFYQGDRAFAFQIERNFEERVIADRIRPGIYLVYSEREPGEAERFEVREHYYPELTNTLLGSGLSREAAEELSKLKIAEYVLGFSPRFSMERLEIDGRINFEAIGSLPGEPLPGILRAIIEPDSKRS